MLKKNEAQEKAISIIHGPVIIISCPGSGKTTTMIRRIHHMIEKGIPAPNILMVTFSKASAKDMSDRYAHMYGVNPGITFATIHSLCFNILRAEMIVSDDSIISANQQYGFIYKKLQKVSWADDLWEASKSIITEISSVRNNLIDVHHYQSESCEPDIFRAIFREYENYKNSIRKIDYDDMLVMVRDLFRKNENVKKRWQDRFPFIQCDEYQDVNYVQRDILYALAERSRNLCVVGDDDQSIYMFRGARSSIMLGFKKDFPDCTEIMMSVNYRSKEPIVEMADLLIQKNTQRFQKEFIAERGAGDDVIYKRYKTREKELLDISKIAKFKYSDGQKYNEMAILYRTNEQAQMIALTLDKNGIPFRTTENIKSLYEGWIFRDIRAYIEMSCGIDPEANMLSVLNHPSRYLKKQRFLNVPFTPEAMNKAILYVYDKNNPWKYSNALHAIHLWMKSFGPGKITMDMDPSKVRAALNEINYHRMLVDMAQRKNIPVKDYEAVYDRLFADAAKFSTIRQWLDFAEKDILRIQKINRERLRSKEGILLATMHRSKGCEWNTVFVVDVNEHIIPGKNSENTDLLEEERRLLYVAMTRAKDHLYIMCDDEDNESCFMEETIKSLKEKRNPKIQKKFKGAKIEHAKYGPGSVVSYAPGKIVVDFEGKQKSFSFPSSFTDGFLKYV